jgi:hypothetical protein
MLYTGDLIIKLSMDLDCPELYFSQKPTDNLKRPGKIFNSILSRCKSNSKKDFSLNSVVCDILKGRSYSPSIFDSNGQWLEQSIFVINLDDGISKEDFRLICDKNRIHPLFVYETYGSSEKIPKYRALFLSNHPVRDNRERFTISYILTSIFNKQIDLKALDTDKVYFGTNKSDHSCYFGNLIDTVDLIEKYTIKLRMDDTNNNFSTKINSFAEHCSLNLVNYSPRTYKLKRDYYEARKTINFDYKNRLLYSREYTNEEDFYIIDFHCSNHDFSPMVSKAQNRDYRLVKDKGIEHLKSTFKSREHINSDNLPKYCQLSRDFENGSRAIDYSTLKLLATNYMQIKGGTKRFLNILDKYKEFYIYDMHSIMKWFITYAKDNKYEPDTCSSTCPYYNCCSCNHNSIISKFDRPKHKVTVLNTIAPKSVESAVVELRQALINFLLNGILDDKLLAIWETGVGKSTIIQELLKEFKLSFLYITPRHRLNNQAFEDFKKIGLDALIVPELPKVSDDEFNHYIDNMYKTGNYSKLYQKIKEKLNVLDDINNEDYKLLSDYIAACIKAKTSDRVVMTHDKFLYSKDKNEYTKGKDILIIDEDILQSILKNSSIDKKDFISLYNFAKNSKIVDKEINDVLYYYNNLIVNLESNKSPVSESSEYYKFVRSEKFVKFLTEAIEIINTENPLNKIDSNLMDFFTAVNYINEFDKANRIAFINKRDLPNNIKTIILSATASDMIYRSLYPDINIVHGGLIQKQGKIIQYPINSYSRTDMKKSYKENPDKFKEDIISRIGNTKVGCTFKEIKDLLREDKSFQLDIQFTYGQELDLNVFSGQNIAIIGTPHINDETYLLVAHALGIKFTTEDITKQNILIERNGLAFWLYTFKSSKELREIQLYFIESQLHQAIGRARLIRNDCTVFLFSNFGIPSAVYMD